MSVVAVIAGAGSGTRLGLDGPKALVKLAGEPLIVHAVRSMAASGVVDRCVVTARRRPRRSSKKPSFEQGLMRLLLPVEVLGRRPLRLGSMRLGAPNSFLSTTLRGH